MSFVIHVLEPAINRCLYGDLRNLGVQYRYEGDIANSPSHMANTRTVLDGDLA